MTSLTKTNSKKTVGSDLDLKGVKSSKNAVRAAPISDGKSNTLESEYQKMIQELTQQVVELNGSMEQVTKEREFYFNKLREIEVFVQQHLDGGLENSLDTTLKSVQEILYKTEEGFELPEVEEQAAY